MLIIELALSKKQALARELRKLIEPEKAQSKRTLRETEIRKYLCKKGLSYYGLSDIISVLKTNYSDLTVSRLISKIQKPVVWDTCICNLPTQELVDLLYNTNIDCIITTSVYEELLKLSLSSSKTKSGVYNALDLIENILDDTDSRFCTIVDLPRDTCVNNYVDNQLLWYCENNNYMLYTHDYVLGLRAKSKGIDVSIFTSFDRSTLPEYTPNPDGKNIILNSDLLNIVSVSEIVETAKEIGANKFILTNEFIENLEDGTKIKILNSELIHFLVMDDDNSYCIYLSSEETSDASELSDRYNAVVFSSSITQCIEYKMNYIPYQMIKKTSDIKFFKNRVHAALTVSPYYTSNFEYEDNLDDDIRIDSETEKVSEVNVAPNLCNEKKKAIGKNSKLIIPCYRPKSHQISVKNIPMNQKIWVLDASCNELTADFKNGFTISIGYKVIHITNNLNNTFKLTVYEILNLNPNDYCKKIASVAFDKNNYSEVVQPEYQTFVRRAIALT